AQADGLTPDHPLDFGDGEGSPPARLVEAGSKVLMAGAPLDTMTLRHHAEHLARVPGNRLRRYEAPILARGTVEWRMSEEFDTSDPSGPGLAEDSFGTIVREFLACGHGRQGMVGRAPSVLVDAAAICAFAVAWIE
ncbi:AAC(3) family N-acetyltransferase, partial [Salinarimonas soli]